MVDYPVPERGGADFSFFGIMDDETAISARLIGFVFQFALQLQHLTLSIELKGGHSQFTALTFTRFAPRFIQIGKAGDLREEIFSIRSDPKGFFAQYDGVLKSKTLRVSAAL